MKKYEFQLDHGKKLMLIKSGGMFSLDDAKNFMAEYKKQVGQIDVKNYSLIIDAKDIKVNGPEIVPLLEEMIQLYASTPFKKRFSVIFESSIAQSQVKRVGKDNFTSAFTFVPSLEDALKQL
ncbi:hypothetical protein [Alkaliphilus crotonatoxidans]